MTNTVKPSGHFVYNQLQHSAILRSAHTVYLCVLCGSENKQRLFPCTALTDWFLQPRRRVFTARYELEPYVTGLTNMRPSVTCVVSIILLKKCNGSSEHDVARLLAQKKCSETVTHHF